MRFVHWLALGSVALVAAGCSDPALEQRVADLEDKIEKVEKDVKNMPKGGGRGGAAAQGNSEDEQAAAKLLKDASDLAADLKWEEAGAKLKELKDKYGNECRACRASDRLAGEIAVVGKDAGSLDVENWYQGEVALNDGKATLLVFWEVWCPHCKREVPKVQATFDKYKGQGLQVVGLTKQTRNISNEQVTSFIEEKGVQYPIAKEAGDAMSQHFGVRGIPAAAMVKDGKVVWRGHPARLTDKMIEDWLS